MPQKSTKHIASKQLPIGSVKNGKKKVIDGETGKVSWRSVRSGMIKDYDGDPTAEHLDAGKMKSTPKHRPHVGYKRKVHKPRGT